MVFADKERPRLRPGSSREAALAFAEVEEEMAALDPERLAPINVDIPRAAITALGAIPSLSALRPRIVKELPTFALASIDNLETYALAAFYAHLLSLPAEAKSVHAPLIEEATKLRRTLLVAAEALADRDLLAPAQVAQIRSGQGHIDTAGDLVALATLFTNDWHKLKTKTAITRAEVERAATLGPELLAALGVREHAGGKSPSQIKEQRRRAFTLLVRAYDQCRRAVTFLRWSEGDTRKIVPSLFASRSKSRRPDAGPPPPDASSME